MEIRPCRCKMAKIINIGAEAIVSSTEWFGKSAISKRRDIKKYRRQEIDEFIRSSRTLKEANMINKIREKLDVPIIYFVDLKKSEIIMENVDGMKVRDVLMKNERQRLGLVPPVYEGENQ